jgi:hypothetical protein
VQTIAQLKESRAGSRISANSFLQCRIPRWNSSVWVRPARRLRERFAAANSGHSSAASCHGGAFGCLFVLCGLDVKCYPSRARGKRARPQNQTRKQASGKWIPVMCEHNCRYGGGIPPGVVITIQTIMSQALRMAARSNVITAAAIRLALAGACMSSRTAAIRPSRYPTSGRSA